MTVQQTTTSVQRLRRNRRTTTSKQVYGPSVTLRYVTELGFVVYSTFYQLPVT